jgi:arginyl-tRNA synthetase
MLRVYVLFHEQAKEDLSLEKEAQDTFKKLESGNAKIRALWKTFRQYSIKEFDELYSRLNISFNKIEGESFYEKSLMPILKDLELKFVGAKSDS